MRGPPKISFAEPVETARGRPPEERAISECDRCSNFEMRGFLLCEQFVEGNEADQSQAPFPLVAGLFLQL